jgi:hypothetical protein
MVEKHEGSVGLADLVLGDGSLAEWDVSGLSGVVELAKTYLSDRIRVASFLVILGSKPPL